MFQNGRGRFLHGLTVRVHYNLRGLRRFDPGELANLAGPRSVATPNAFGVGAALLHLKKASSPRKYERQTHRPFQPGARAFTPRPQP
jgi:hypothetical protein